MKQFVTIRTKTSVRDFLQWKADKYNSTITEEIKGIVIEKRANLNTGVFKKYKPTKGGETVLINCRLPKYIDWLTAQAKKEGVSRGKFVERLILADKKAHEDLWGKK